MTQISITPFKNLFFLKIPKKAIPTLKTYRSWLTARQFQVYVGCLAFSRGGKESLKTYHAYGRAKGKWCWRRDRFKYSKNLNLIRFLSRFLQIEHAQIYKHLNILYQKRFIIQQKNIFKEFGYYVNAPNRFFELDNNPYIVLDLHNMGLRGADIIDAIAQKLEKTSYQNLVKTGQIPISKESRPYARNINPYSMNNNLTEAQKIYNQRKIHLWLNKKWLHVPWYKTKRLEFSEHTKVRYGLVTHKQYLAYGGMWFERFEKYKASYVFVPKKRPKKRRRQVYDADYEAQRWSELMIKREQIRQAFEQKRRGGCFEN